MVPDMLGTLEDNRRAKRGVRVEAYIPLQIRQRQGLEGVGSGTPRALSFPTISVGGNDVFTKIRPGSSF